jgi:hypothetical protein
VLGFRMREQRGLRWQWLRRQRVQRGERLQQPLLPLT